jgi:hypothetical protein
MHRIAIRTLLLIFAMLAVSVPAFSQVAVGVSVGFGPPAIPVYDQPICPGDGYIWTPGYWAWDADDDDYYWVPGTWVEPPEAGLFWTPGYWVWNNDGFVFTDGYWGPVVGFYGGINYGFGYFGTGFVGGRWDGGHFFYNRAVSRVDVNVIHNVYEERVTNVTVNRVSYNGGNGGINARPTPQEEAARNDRHVAAVAAQTQQIQAARGNRDLRASANHGKPPIAATDRPGAFNDHVVKAKDAGAPYNPPANRNAANKAANNPNEAERANSRPNNENVERSNNRPNNMNSERPGNNSSNNAVVHPKDMPAYERPAAPNTGNAKLDQKYQQQQQKMAEQQDQQRQKLQQQQDNEHQRYAKQQADEQKNQALEQKHQQQTQQLQQRQAQQQQAMQRRQAPPPAAHAAPAEHSAPADPREK